MLQVSRLAPRLLGDDAADLVRGFVLDQLHADGGFLDRTGRPDLYYTVFGLSCLQALQMEIPPRVRSYLESFGRAEQLDFVHTACLARAWSAVGGEGFSAELRGALFERLVALRLEDLSLEARGAATEDGIPGSVTDAFLGFGTLQDLGMETPSADEIAAFLGAREAADGGYLNEPPAISGSTPATTAAVSLLASVGRPIPRHALGWLEARHVHGGFNAAPGLDIPDLLSTAVVLHALATAQRPLQRYVEPALDFLDTLWTNRGAFHGHWADDDIDCEYTFYGLLALGHLSVWS